MKKTKYKPKSNLVKTGVKNIVGVGLISATSNVVSALPTGTAKSIAGVVPGLQAVALVKENAKGLNFKLKKQRRK